MESHGGFLPGNMTVSAKASNLTLRRLAVCDVASLVSRVSTAGAGLSLARLINLRYAAISYRRGSYSPQYLVAAMVEFGVNFATFQALDADALDALSDSLSKGWRADDSAASDSSDSEASMEPLITCRFAEPILRQMGKATEGAIGDSSAEIQAEEDESVVLATLLSHFNLNAVNSSGSDCDEQAEEVRTRLHTGPRATQSASRKRKGKSKSSSGGAAKVPRTGVQTEETSAGTY